MKYFYLAASSVGHVFFSGDDNKWIGLTLVTISALILLYIINKDLDYIDSEGQED